MDDKRLERYRRQIALKGFGESAQQKLSDAKVLVVGAGGLGCPVLQYLAAAGVGTIGIVDHDHISLHNLHRQILYGTGDVGKSKADVAARKLKGLNPEINVVSYAVKLVRGNVLNLLADYDLIVDGTDNFTSRYLINDACMVLRKPLVFAAISDYEGQVAVFNVDDAHGVSTNYRDLFPDPPAPGEIPNCEENGVIGVLPGIIGVMQAAEVIKLITGIGEPLINRLLNYSLLTQQTYEIHISPGSVNSYSKPLMNDFMKHEDAPVTEIEGSELATLLQNNNAILIDVREYHETPKLHSDSYQQVPMSVLDEELLSKISQEHVIMICQHGIRSLNAAEFLKDHGLGTKTIYSLKGGVVRWLNELKELSVLNN